MAIRHRYTGSQVATFSTTSRVGRRCGKVTTYSRRACCILTPAQKASTRLASVGSPRPILVYLADIDSSPLKNGNTTRQCYGVTSSPIMRISKQYSIAIGVRRLD